jgi:hypothetical protein
VWSLASGRMPVAAGWAVVRRPVRVGRVVPVVRVGQDVDRARRGVGWVVGWVRVRWRAVRRLRPPRVGVGRGAGVRPVVCRLVRCLGGARVRAMRIVSIRVRRTFRRTIRRVSSARMSSLRRR